MARYQWKHTIRINILILKLVGLWPPEDESYKFNCYTFYAIISINLFINGQNFFQTMNIFLVFPDLEALAETIFVTLTELLASVKIYYFARNMGLLKKLMIELNSEIFQPKSDKQIILIKPSLFSWTVTYIVFWVPVVSTLFFWAIFPIMDGSVKVYRLPFSAWYPFNTKISPWYELTYIYQVISVCFLAIANMNMDTLIAGFLMYVGAQCDILCDDVKSLRGSLGCEFAEKLVVCIQHHRILVKFAEDCNKFFNMIVLGQFFTSVVTIGLAMFRLTLVAPTSSEAFSLFCYVGTMTVQVFLYCWFGNEVELK
ncbi:7tm 6 domain containing protein, partial [Asbolus verrucosus]